MDESRRRMLSLPLLALAGAPHWIGRPQSASAQRSGEAGHRLSISTARPRLWWTAETLEAARKRYSPGRFRLRRDDYAGYAYRYLMAGNQADARTAIDWAMGLTFSTAGTSSNEARWFGEAAILVYDWLHDQFTAGEREVFIERWNGYVDALRRKEWGGPAMPQSNYFWGYLRNELEWAIATYGENPMAESFLDDALRVRWQESFLPNTQGPARGGLPVEGSQYGRYLLNYAGIPLFSAHLHGRPMFEETNFFREAVFWLIYATAPAPTTSRSGGSPRWEVFPLGDDQFFRNGGSAESVEYGAFASTIVQLWGELPVGQYARKWLKLTSAARPEFMSAAEPSGEEKEFQSLPLDYFAPGPQHLYARTSWGGDATVIHLQLGAMKGGSHEHADHGTWQMWRKGRWLSRETTGYADRFTGYAGRGVVEASNTAAHNGILLNGKGLADGQRNGPPVLRRLERRDAWVCAAVDLTPSYRNNQVSGRAERDNPAAASVEREFVFLRALETLVIFDRVRAGGAGMPPDQVSKTFLAHFEENPVLEGANVVLAANGDQMLRLVTVAPAEAVRRVIPEDGPLGQYRLEVESQGSESTYFLHVLQARNVSDPDLQMEAEETADQFLLALGSPERGYARIVLNKQSSSLTALGVARDGMPADVSGIPDRVREIRVTADGPAWEDPGGDSETSPNEASAGARSGKRQTRKR